MSLFNHSFDRQVQSLKKGNMKKLLLFALTLITTIGYGQISQNIRGIITDKDSKTPLIGASVVIENLTKGTTTDVDGRFILEEVPIGRHNLKVTYIGYEERTLANIQVISGKETVLNIELQESAFQSKEVVVVASQQNKEKPLNEMATVSTRQFRVEETQRYAGARGDVSRMAANFAGVSGANDSRNDIVIRGNSPLGLLWRMEGVDIPNPNHFGGFGSTGGPVSILNNNLLANSDFFTGAFPAEYGNANSGVFDLKIRNGNDEKYEFTGQIGFNGFELGAEGPIVKEKGSSFLANYRYSTLGFFDLIGVSFGFVGIPQYQDVSFKINAPNSPLGNISVFGIGGISAIEMLANDREEGELNLNGGQDLLNSTNMGVMGITHRYLINKHSFTNFTVSGTALQEKTTIDGVDTAGNKTDLNYHSDFIQQRWSARLVYQNKINTRTTFKSGLTFNTFITDLVDSFRVSDNNYQTLRNFNGNANMLQGFAQLKHRFTPRLTAVGGLYSQYLWLNDQVSLEPRLGFQYQVNGQQRLSLGYGRHAQLQPFPIYFSQTKLANDTYIETNKNLDFTYSNHLVLGYDYNINADWRIKSELYYQYLNNVPIQTEESSFSLLNYGVDFGNLAIDSLVNEGIGRNYGLEMTIEKFFSHNNYLLVTASIFDSKYQGSDKTWRSTAFNTNYVLNVLYGMEFKIGKNNFLSFDLKTALAGGRRYTPVDETASLLQGEIVYLNDQAFEKQFKTYFKPDIQLAFRNNLKNYSQMWAVSIENVINRDNVFRQTYNPSTNQIETEYQLGLFPVFLYKVEF